MYHPQAGLHRFATPDLEIQHFVRNAVQIGRLPIYYEHVKALGTHCDEI